MYEPALISDNEVLTTPNTATSSVTRTFMSEPSRDLMLSIGPSTASMVPRIRTVGAGCAHAAVTTERTVSDATSRRGINEKRFDMALPSGFLGETMSQT